MQRVRNRERSVTYIIPRRRRSVNKRSASRTAQPLKSPANYCPLAVLDDALGVQATGTKPFAKHEVAACIDKIRLCVAHVSNARVYQESASQRVSTRSDVRMWWRCVAEIRLIKSWRNAILGSLPFVSRPNLVEALEPLSWLDTIDDTCSHLLLQQERSILE